MPTWWRTPCGRASAGSGRSTSPLGADLPEHGVVVGRVDDDGDAVVVLRRRPDHRRAADVDQVDAGIGGERVEVDDHEVDRFDPVLGEIGAMRRIRRVGEDAAVHLRVKGHDAVTEDCREPGELGDVGDRHSAGRDLPRRAAARQHPPAGGMESLGEFGDSRLVVHGQQRGGHGGTS